MHHVESTVRATRPARPGAVRRPKGAPRGRRPARLSIATAAAAAALALSVGTAWAAPAVTPPLGGIAQWRASLNPGRNIPAAEIGTSAISICAKVATKAGFSFNQTVNTALGPEPRVAVAIAIAMAESSCTLDATNHDSNGSRDRGLWQINNAAWPSISNACAYQIQCNANAAYNISAYGSSWSPWATFTNGAWQRYIGSAVSAIGSGFSFQLANQGNGTCLAVGSGGAGSTGGSGNAGNPSSANGAPIILSTCNTADDGQQWRVVDVPGHMFILQNVSHGSCLDADGMSKGPGKPIFQWACDGSNASEQWSFNGSGTLNSNGNAQAGLQNVKDGTCLAADTSNPANAGGVVQGNCAAGDGFQVWN